MRITQMQEKIPQIVKKMKKYLIRNTQKVIYTRSEYFHFRETRKKFKKEFTFWALEIFSS